MEIVLLVLVWSITVALAAVIFPLAYAAGGYFTGWILAFVFKFAGDWVVNGLGIVGLEITRSQLPVLGAALGFVGAFFKSAQKNENKAK